jgi:hypothetical protein
MKHKNGIARVLASSVLVAGCFFTIQARANIGDSPEITKLLAEAKAEAAELKHDSSDMDAFVKSKLSWSSFADKVNMIREHVNACGKLLTKMKDQEAAGSPWQQTAVSRIEPLLRELAANTEATIIYLNDNRTKVHFPEFADYVKANYDLASDLESLIRDFVNYGETKDRFQNLRQKLEISTR